MNKITILVFALAITHALGAATCPNPLATALSVTNTNAAQSAAFGGTNTVCKSFDTGTDSCCDVSVINGFATRAATLIGDLEDDAETQDKAILAARKNLAGLSDKLDLFQAAYTAAETKLTAQVTAGTTNAATVKTFLTALKTDVTAFFTNYNTLRTNFGTYQTKRQTCLTALVKAQVAGWCLACNKNAEDLLGVTLGTPNTVTYHADFITSLRDACYPYFVASAEQTDILRLSNAATPVETYTAGLVKIAADDNTGIASINSAIPTNTVAGISKVPAQCTATACDWIKDSLFVNAKLDEALAIRGGSATRRLQESRSSGRMLAGTFGSATTLANEAKIAITVDANPGDVSNPNDLSALRVGVFSCIAAFFVALLI